jgi:hypothetical protein
MPARPDDQLSCACLQMLDIAGSTLGPVNGQVAVTCPATGLAAGQYTITLTAVSTSSNGCPSSTQIANVNVTVRPAPTIQIGSPQAVAPGCTGAAVQTVTATFSYIVTTSPNSGALQLTATASASQVTTCTVASKLLSLSLMQMTAAVHDDCIYIASPDVASIEMWHAVCSSCLCNIQQVALFQLVHLYLALAFCHDLH